MFRPLFSLVIMVSVTACVSANNRAPAQADGAICSSVAECQFIEDKANLKTRELLAGKLPAFTEILRDEQGAVLFVYRKEADKYCQARNARLPSARDWAQYAVSTSKVTGVLDVDYVKKNFNDHAPKGFQWIGFVDNDKNRFSFYYNQSAYIVPADPASLDRNVFWTSSWDSSSLTWENMAFFGAHGFFSRTPGKAAIRCIAN